MSARKNKKSRRIDLPTGEIPMAEELPEATTGAQQPSPEPLDSNRTEQDQPAYPHLIEDKINPWTQWPMVLGIVIIWCALWQTFDLFTIVGGLIATLVVMTIFRMPPVPFSGRFNPYYAAKFTVIFLWKILVASLHVAKDAIFVGPNIQNAVIGVKLRSHDDLIVTLVGHAYALIPGSLVIDIDRATSTLYLHVLDIKSDREAENFRTESLEIEARIIRALGSKDDYKLVRAEDRANDGVIRRQTDQYGQEYTR